MDPIVVKRCACGTRYTQCEWDSLLLVGYMEQGDEGHWPLLELRECHCGSTLAIERLEKEKLAPAPEPNDVRRLGRSHGRSRP